MTKRLILVAGNIGAGKTSLTEKLGERLGWRTGFESVTDNPYLADFYQDMPAWAFHLQIFHLGNRSEQIIDASLDPKSAILDRSIYEDYYIFTRALRHMDNISERDYNAYHRLFDLVITNLPVPDLLIYLHAPVEVLINRIQDRGRNIESGIPAEYLNLLDSLYIEWLAEFDLCPVLTIRSNDLDFVNKADDLDTVIKRINHTLSGKEELVFPDN